jgi:hypothetical protein
VDGEWTLDHVLVLGRPSSSHILNDKRSMNARRYEAKRKAYCTASAVFLDVDGADQSMLMTRLRIDLLSAQTGDPLTEPCRFTS